MTKSNGIASLKQAAKLLNKHSPDGESLAYINPEEAKLLRSHGGSGIMTVAGVPSYNWLTDAITKYAPKVLSYAGSALDLYKKFKKKPDDGLPDYGSPGQENPYFNIDDRSPNPLGYDYPTYDKQGNVLKPWETTPFDPAQGNIPYEPESGGGFWGDLISGVGQGIKERYSDPRNIAKDLGSLYIAKEAYEGKKDLNDWERKKYEEVLADIAKGEAKYASDVGAAPLEITNMPTPEKLAQFTETTGMPEMITTPTAAEGGRIGAFNGGIQGLMPQQGMPQQGMPQQGMLQQGMLQQGFMPPQGLDPRMGYAAQGGRIGYNLGGIDRPFQGIGALNPRMGYATQGFVGTTPEEGDMEFEKEIIHPGTLDEGNIGMPGQPTTEFEHEGAQAQDDSLIQKIIKIAGSVPTPFNPYLVYKLVKEGGVEIMEAIEIVKNKMGGEVTEEVTENGPPDWAKDFLDKLNKGEVEWPKPDYPNEMRPLNVAQGGRIGYQEAGPVLSEQQIAQIKQMAAMGSDIPTISSITEATIDQINNVLNPPVESQAYGGRIGAQGGGIMPLLDMGGMEKDYRQEGGFVPIGRKEKADDVPARLSKNEFVFTADAVKAAGGGDIDEGAQRMYNVMKNLEAGGEISEQSQGQA